MLCSRCSVERSVGAQLVFDGRLTRLGWEAEASPTPWARLLLSEAGGVCGPITALRVPAMRAALHGLPPTFPQGSVKPDCPPTSLLAGVICRSGHLGLLCTPGEFQSNFRNLPKVGGWSQPAPRGPGSTALRLRQCGLSGAPRARRIRRIQTWRQPGLPRRRARPVAGRPGRSPPWRQWGLRSRLGAAVRLTSC